MFKSKQKLCLFLSIFLKVNKQLTGTKRLFGTLGLLGLKGGVRFAFGAFFELLSGGHPNKMCAKGKWIEQYFFWRWPSKNTHTLIGNFVITTQMYLFWSIFMSKCDEATFFDDFQKISILFCVCTWVHAFVKS